MPRKKKPIDADEQPKLRGLFDHIKHIRREKSESYYDDLSDEEKKSFNHYMVVRILSMDPAIIEEIAYISKYFDKIPSNLFYKLCCDLTPVSYGFFPYIKSKKNKYNETLVELVSKRYNISTKEANNYCEILFEIENGEDELTEICRGYGLSDKEIKKLLTKKD